MAKFYEVIEKEFGAPVDMIILEKGACPERMALVMGLGEKYELRRIEKSNLTETVCRWFNHYRNFVHDKEHIGQVAVDSGQLMITDPCYVIDKGSEEEYRKTSEASLSEKHCGQVLDGLGIAFSTAHGDGFYDVYAKRNKKGGIEAIEIDLS